MNAVSARTLDFFDRHVVQNIVEKYGFDECCKRKFRVFKIIFSQNK